MFAPFSSNIDERNQGDHLKAQMISETIELDVESILWARWRGFTKARSWVRSKKLKKTDLLRFEEVYLMEREM